MSTRFATNGIVAVAAGFLVVASQGFAPSTTGWIAFGIAIGILALTGLAQANSSRGVEQRALDGVVAIVAIWTIVASVVFDGTALKWLSAGEAIALVAIAAAGLAVNEVSEQRAVHAASDTTMGESLRAAA